MAAEARSIQHNADDRPMTGLSPQAASGPGRPRTADDTGAGQRLTPLRELQLLEAYRRGGDDSHRALTELLAAYQRRVYSVCFRMVRRPEDAADLTQDVLLKVVEHLSSYDGRSKLSTWIIRVALNASLSHLRRAKTRETRSLDSGAAPSGRIDLDSTPNQSPTAAPAGREPSPPDSVEQQQRRSLVVQTLDSLDPDTKAILVLRDMQDMDYQQLAEALDVPLGTIKSRLFRARAAFREAFEARGGT
jgi:RNA polymerase sigma-70 factor (ECF subfamily)